jgi:hypothetical protein
MPPVALPPRLLANRRHRADPGRAVARPCLDPDLRCPRCTGLVGFIRLGVGDGRMAVAVWLVLINGNLPCKPLFRVQSICCTGYYSPRQLMMVITSRIVVRELISRRSLATAWGISAASRRYGKHPCFLAGHAHGPVSQP